MNTYVSCNCRRCRGVTSGIKSGHKKVAHRTLRRIVRREEHRLLAEANFYNCDLDDSAIPASVSSGYRT